MPDVLGSTLVLHHKDWEVSSDLTSIGLLDQASQKLTENKKQLDALELQDTDSNPFLKKVNSNFITQTIQYILSLESQVVFAAGDI